MVTENTSSSDAFAKLARGFCSWCEGSSLGPNAAASAASWLSRLYAAALELPSVEPENAEGLPELPPTLLQQATETLASFNGHLYRELFDPDPHLDVEPVMGDVGDDLLDTYKDVRAGLLLYELGHVEEALWHWAFLHRVHWGRHAVGAIFALHCLNLSKAE